MSREPLKSLEALFEPDQRMANTVIRDIRTPESSTPYTIVEHYKRHADLRLTAPVPDEVANSWTAAQHLAIYGFYVYQFIPLAMHQALTTLELALRLRLQREDNPGLKKLLRQASSKNLFDK